jgi:hypothetical protein
MLAAARSGGVEGHALEVLDEVRLSIPRWGGYNPPSQEPESNPGRFFSLPACKEADASETFRSPPALPFLARYL